MIIRNGFCGSDPLYNDGGDALRDRCNAALSAEQIFSDLQCVIQILGRVHLHGLYKVRLRFGNQYDVEFGQDSGQDLASH